MLEALMKPMKTSVRYCTFHTRARHSQRDCSERAMPASGHAPGPEDPARERVLLGNELPLISQHTLTLASSKFECVEVRIRSGEHVLLFAQGIGHEASDTTDPCR